MKHLLKKLTLLSLALTLGACGWFSQAPDGEWLSAQQQLANSQISHWQLSGKIGLRSQNNANTGYLNWQQCAEHFDIRLTGPLGQGAAHLYGDSKQVSLQTKDSTQTAPNPEQLLTQELGWSIPVTQLLYWVRGIPSPDQASSSLTNNGFTQMGWAVHYSKWQTIQGYRLPKKAIANHPQLKVTLILKNWQLDTDCSIETN